MNYLSIAHPLDCGISSRMECGPSFNLHSCAYTQHLCVQQTLLSNYTQLERKTRVIYIISIKLQIKYQTSFFLNSLWPSSHRGFSLDSSQLQVLWPHAIRLHIPLLSGRGFNHILCALTPANTQSQAFFLTSNSLSLLLQRKIISS